MYNMVKTDVICPECGEGRMIREEPKVIKSNTERYAYLCPDCGFVHTAKSDEDMEEWIKSLDKPTEEEILKEQVRAFIGIVDETTDKHIKEKVWPPEDPVDIHDEISKGFARIENVIREESAKMAEIIRQAVIQPAPQVVWTNYIPEACRSCSNHPANGGTGNCNCTLGSPSVTCDVTDCSWR